jgi:hypothetical protein
MIRKLLLCLFLLSTGLALGYWLAPAPNPPPTSPVPPVRHVHGDITIQQIQELAQLLTVQADVADIQETTLTGRPGGIRALLLVRGDFRLASDLSQARLEDVDPDKKTATLILPPPQVLAPRLDHQRTRLFALQTFGLWVLIPGDRAETSVSNSAYAEAQRIVAVAAQSPQIVQRARKQAEVVLGCFFTAIGWQVQVRWADRESG